jgi:hypothetical protein
MTIAIPGNGATIQSDSVEQQLIDCVVLIKNLEKNTAKNPTNKNAIACSFNLSTGVSNISFQVPAIPIINSSGQQVQQANGYLIETGFSPGTDGTFKSEIIEAYLLEILTYLEILEGNTSKNPNQNNYVASTFDADARSASGTATIPITFEVGTGNTIKIMASEYLLD